jgi:hypothetical protein
MTIPLGVRRQIERVENNLKKLSPQLAIEILNGTPSDVDLQLHTFCRELSDCCDQVANAVWLWIHFESTTTKPNVYWPTSIDETGFTNLLLKQKMSILADRAPVIFQTFKETQSWHNSSSTIPILKQIASSRHSQNLEVDVSMEQSTSIGHVEVVHIEKLSTDANGEIVELRGTEISGGVSRPLSVRHHLTPRAVDQKTKRELFRLLTDACSEIKRCCAVIYGKVSP